MENASKGLLIAAGVLIAIILVTISIKILNPTKSVIEDSEQLGSAISSSSSDAVDKFEASIGGKWTQDKTIVKRGSLILEVGDYINYDAGVSGYTGKWRILGVENGQLLIVSDQLSDVYLYGKDGYNNAISKFNAVCEKYGKGKGATSVRSIKAEDINRVIGYDPKEYQRGELSEYGCTVTFTLEDGMVVARSTNGKTYKSDYNELINVDGVKLEAGNSITITNNYYCCSVLSGIKENAYNALFKFGYWLYPTKYADVGYISYGCQRVSGSAGIEGRRIYETSNQHEEGSTNYVRAVVYLKSDIQLQKNGSTWKIV